MATSKQVDSDTDTDAVSKEISGYDETSGIWLEEFSLLLNYMFPVEDIFYQWYRSLEMNERHRMQGNIILTGSTIEGFSIPIPDLMQNVNYRNLLQTDLDVMLIKSNLFQSKMTGVNHPIFVIQHALDDPRYVKLQVTKELRCEFLQFAKVKFLNHALMFDANVFSTFKKEKKNNDIFMNTLQHGPLKKEYIDAQSQNKLIRGIHGPVYRQLCRESISGLSACETDISIVFTYPNAWPEKAIEWLDRVRPNNWPSPDLIQEIFQSGCHIAPVGRGKRSRDPIDRKDYTHNPVAAVADTKTGIGMDETEWRISFSIAENKLAASVSPIQRPVMVLFKMLKKMYFSEISTYMLKNLAFWEFERKGGLFWNDDNIAVCLLFMLDQLIQCLKEGFLPHYIMPESNLLEGEDPALLKKAAETIVKIRRNVLHRTLSMVRRLHDLSFGHDYIKGTDFLDFKDITLNIESKKLKDEERLAVKRNICNALAKKYTARLSFFSCKASDVEITMVKAVNFEILKLIYQSVLARLFCKLYHLYSKKRPLENMVVDETKYFSDANRIILQSKEYLHAMANGNNLSTLVQTSASMVDAREMTKCHTWSLKLAYEIAFHYRPMLVQINDYLEVVKDFVENKWNLKRHFRGLERVKLVVLTMVYIERFKKNKI